MVIDPRTIEAIYRMSHEQKLSRREIARQLHVSRKAIRKYLDRSTRQTGRSKTAWQQTGSLQTGNPGTAGPMPARQFSRHSATNTASRLHRWADPFSRNT